MATDERTSRPMLLLLLLLFSFSTAACDLWSTKATSGRFSLPETGPEGFVIDTSGGAGTVGSGGDAYYDWGIYIDSYGPLGVQVRKDGEVDASFTAVVPEVTVDLGAEPLIVGQDMIIPVYPFDPDADGVYYYLENDRNLYHKIDSETVVVVTGIRVSEGATLTLGLNFDWNGNGRYETARLYLSDDLEVLGTLRTAAFEDEGAQDSGYGKDHGALYLEISGGVFVRPTGIVSTAGEDSATGRGGHGGYIDIETYAESSNGGIFLNQGIIDASGGNSTDPGSEGGNAVHYGGSWYGIYLYSEIDFLNAGTFRANGGNGGTDGGSWQGTYGFLIDAVLSVTGTGTISLNGGNGAGGNGGNGGNLDIYSANASLYHSGTITAKGGSGRVNGGNGSYVCLYLGSDGDILNSGDIDTSGGDSTGTDDAEPGCGGYAGSIYLYGYGGDLLSSGNLTASGGNSANANASSCGGSAGDYIDIELFAGDNPAGVLEVSGNVVAKGGSGANGGNGGDVYIHYDDSGGTGGVVLRGYSNILANGGSGAANGGTGGNLYLSDDFYGDPAAEVVNEADIDVDGGDNLTSGDGYGGSGGYVDLWSGQGSVSNIGSITGNGGDAVMYAGGGGYFSLYSSSGTVETPGALAADGGDSATTAQGSGACAGDGGYVQVYSGIPPSTYGTITADPGSGGDPDNPASDGTIEIDGGGGPT